MTSGVEQEMNRAQVTPIFIRWAASTTAFSFSVAVLGTPRASNGLSFHSGTVGFTNYSYHPWTGGACYG
jgi:hypothetical protein